MQILLAVIDDLLQFARTAILGVIFEKETQMHKRNFALPAKTPQLQLPSLTDSILEISEPAETDQISFMQGASYFIGEPRAFLYCEPVVAFDTASMHVPYGSLVRVVKLGGRWAEVVVEGTEGWIFKDVLREQVSDVFPAFIEGEVYSAENEDTKRLRTYIEDSFGAGAAALPLTDAEFVTYKLMKRDIHIPWTLERPRNAGTWQRKLRGRVGIHMSITPFVGTVMEYVLEDQGHLCFVEAVFPDERITISEVNNPDNGIYNERTLTKEEWQALNPLFIQVA